jgi:hypothetical protein
LQETKNKVRSIKEIYEQQVKDGVDIANLTSLNTYRGAIGLTMDMFLNNKIEENALGQLSAVAKKEKRHQTGLARKDGGDFVPEYLAWTLRTRVERERKEIVKEKSGVLSIQPLKEKVEDVIQKGPDPQSGKWNNRDFKVMIQWHKRAGDGAMPKNREGLLLRYRETCGHVMPGWVGNQPRQIRKTYHNGLSMQWAAKKKLTVESTMSDRL